MLLVLSFLLVFPPKNIEPTWGPFELCGILWLMSLSHVVFKPHYGVSLAPEALGDVGGDADALVVGQLHYPPGVPDVVLLQMNVLHALSVTQVAELVRGRGNKPFCLRVVDHSTVMKGLQKPVDFVGFVATLELDWHVFPSDLVHTFLYYRAFSWIFNDH